MAVFYGRQSTVLARTHKVEREQILRILLGKTVDAFVRLVSLMYHMDCCIG